MQIRPMLMCCVPFFILNLLEVLNMGVYSEIDMGYEDDHPFEVNDVSVTEAAAPQQSIAASGNSISSASQAVEDTEDSGRKAHEEAELKRKAEWDAKQNAKKAAEEARLAQLAAMSDEEIMMASTQRISTETERLTRRNMKECVAEYIQTICLDDPTFARKVMHPRKSMIHCIWYINRKAREYAEREMKDNGFKPENGVYGCDVPDDLCYSWAEDYFNDPNAKEDEEKEEKFVPKPYSGNRAKSKGKTAKEPSKSTAAKKPQPKNSDDAQLSLLGDAG